MMNVQQLLLLTLILLLVLFRLAIETTGIDAFVRYALHFTPGIVLDHLELMLVRHSVLRMRVATEQICRVRECRC